MPLCHGGMDEGLLGKWINLMSSGVLSHYISEWEVIDPRVAYSCFKKDELQNSVIKSYSER